MDLTPPEGGEPSNAYKQRRISFRDPQLNLNYLDSSAAAKEKLPDLKNHKLKTLAKHFKLPPFKHHDAAEDACACANIFLKLQELHTSAESPGLSGNLIEFRGLAMGILADDEVSYKEVCTLLYWLEDHSEVLGEFRELYSTSKQALEDDEFDSIEATEIKKLLEQSLIKS